jgi:hypothetical protein
VGKQLIEPSSDLRIAARSISPLIRNEPGFPGCRANRHGTDERDLVAVVDHPFDVIDEELPRLTLKAGRKEECKAGYERPPSEVRC